MKNRFNNLTSKEWLPFQKSWFKYASEESLLDKNIGFFCKLENPEAIAYHGPDYALFEKIALDKGFTPKPLDDFEGETQFILIDIRKDLSAITSVADYNALRQKTMALITKKSEHLIHRRFVAVLGLNKQDDKCYFPFAWDLAKHIGSYLSLKDEKIGCLESETAEIPEKDFFKPAKSIFYSLYFRKDERSAFEIDEADYGFFNNIAQTKTEHHFKESIPKWFILKPRRRKKNEILHPAKYPEDLVELFISTFTEKGANVFDPMSGAGSTQIGALKLDRNGYGTELSTFFAEIANTRCQEFTVPTQKALFGERHEGKFLILNKDAREITAKDFPKMDYLITSPPYWDMLNMKGAENQAKRIKKGLKTNYSENTDDLGNIEDYRQFLEDLKAVYFNLAKLMKPGSYMCIVVKNIKKKGSNYPFAWDLTSLLKEKLVLLPEVFWVQDDISIAPYGYGNTFVSNTFHQYCLTFQVLEGLDG